MTEYFNQILAVLSLVILVVFVVLVLALIFKRSSLDENIFSIIKKYSYQIIFLLSFSGTLGSLIYSEVVDYAPCILCWWQRIFLYPIVVISAIALFKKDKTVNDYILGLSIPGFVIALYHSVIQVSSSINPFLCTGLEGDCTNVYFVEFGFVTLPFMAFSVFALITTLALVNKIKHLK